jgi:three-Cys-motif partner protein
MPSQRRSKPSTHPDQTRPIEAHAQTQHKLDVMRRSFGQYPSVLIEASKRHKNVVADDIWIVDAFAGAGLHLSADHPDGSVPGTALQACYQARRVQRKYPNARIHVRLIDSNEAFCAKLVERTAKFRAGSGSDNLDVQIVPGEVADRLEGIARETRRIGGYNFSLWFFDPYGVKAIPKAMFAPLLKIGYGPEIVINLDVSGLFRIRAAATSDKAELYEIYESISAADRRLLTAVYGSNAWEDVYGQIKPKGSIGALKVLADSYAASFQEHFPNATTHALRSSDGQVRYLVHLSKSKSASEKFTSSYNASLKIGLWQGNQLDLNARARAADALFEIMRGQDVSIGDLHEAQLYPLNRAQLRVVLNEAYDLGYGTFDGDTMHWFEARQADSTRQIPLVAPASTQTSLFDP